MKKKREKNREMSIMINQFALKRILDKYTPELPKELEKWSWSKCTYDLQSKKRDYWERNHPFFTKIINKFHYVRYTNWFDELKWFCQRGKRGYSDCDIWGFDGYLIKLVLDGLKQLKKNLHGYPVNLTEGQWYDIMQKMIDSFELLYKYVEGDKLFDNPKFDDKFRKKFNVFTKEETKIINRGLTYFRKHFFDLWD